MKIILAKRSGRVRMTCHRVDGSVTTADLGPSFPDHDLAHYVAERTLRLTTGFFGHVERGYSLQALSEAATIRALGAEPYVAEVLARALGALSSGACTRDQFPDLVGAELAQMRLAAPPGVTVENAGLMLEEFQSLRRCFQALPPGESIELEFGAAGPIARDVRG